MNILITDYYCASNRGDAAILEGVYEALKETYPTANISVMTENPRAAKLVHGIDTEKQTLADFEWRFSKKNAARMYLSMIGPFYNRNKTFPGFEYIKNKGNIEPYLEADLVVSTGGQFLTDIYFPSKIGVLWEHYFLSQINTPFVIYAQTLGPFNRSLYRRMTKVVLDKAAVIITRDRKSKSIVDDLNISTPIYFTADAAFSIDLDKNKKTPLDTLGAKDVLPDKDETTISISVREWKYTDSSTNVDDYAKDIADIADWLIEEKEVDILFASTCTGLAGYSKDDRLIAAKIADYMEYGSSEKVQILTGEYTPRQLVEVYEHMDLHVGMRMHSNILAMMAETPVVAIQYQFKTEGLMQMFDLRDYMIDINDVDRESLQQLIDTAYENRSLLSENIKSELPTIQKESHRSAKLIKDHF